MFPINIQLFDIEYILKKHNLPHTDIYIQKAYNMICPTYIEECANHYTDAANRIKAALQAVEDTLIEGGMIITPEQEF